MVGRGGDQLTQTSTDAASGTDPLKNWTVKYLQFVWNMRQLRGVYAASSTTPEALRSTVEMTFSSCSGLADWLVAGPEPKPIAAAEVGNLVESDPLRVCRALAGAHRPATARVVGMPGGARARAWVELEQVGMRTVRFDALDLAERCLAAWNWFLQERGVALPSWDSGAAARSLG